MYLYANFLRALMRGYFLRLTAIKSASAPNAAANAAGS